jgi:hypothetical protein
MIIEKKPLMVVSRAVRSMMAAELLAPSTQSKKHTIGPRTFRELYDLHLGAHEVDAEVREAAINLAREVEKRAFQAGLEAAADYLKGTASDYQQSIDRDQNSRRRLTENERRNIRLNKEKVALLRGQAGHVLSLPFK